MKHIGRKILTLALCGCMTFTLPGIMTAADEVTLSEDQSTVVLDNDGTAVTASAFDKYFSGTAADGVKALLSAGKCYINGIQIPATDAGITAYQINWVNALSKEDAGWAYIVNDTSTVCSTYAEAALNLFTKISALCGQQTTLYLDASGKCTAINLQMYESVRESRISDLGNDRAISNILDPGTDINKNNMKTREDGREIHWGTDYFGQFKLVKDGEVQYTGWEATANTLVSQGWTLANTLADGDFALYWYGTDTVGESSSAAWHLINAEKVTGKVSKVSDGVYSVDGKELTAAGVSEYNVLDAFKADNAYAAIETLGLKESNVTAWTTANGALIGFSYGTNRAGSKANARTAVANANAFADSVVESADGSDVEEGKLWATKADIEAFKSAITTAQSVANKNASSQLQIDAAIYQLYLDYVSFEKITKHEAKDEVIANLTVAADNSGRMPTGLALTDTSYDKYFGAAEGAAATAVPEILAAGNLYINGSAFPKTLAEYKEKGFAVNTSAVTVSAETEDAYAAAAVSAATNAVPIGNTIALIDTNGDGYCDKISYSCYASFIVNKITTNTDSTVTVERAAIEGTKPYDQQLFAAGNTDKVKAENFASDIEVGDMALARYMNGEWVLIRAQEVNAVLVDGQDHGSYNMGGTEYADAMRFSRDNIVISNRCGEFTNAQKYFGLNNKEYKVSLWLVPTGDGCTTTGAPCGFTSNENGKTFLGIAIKAAQAKLDSVKISEDGTDVYDADYWVSQAVYDELKAAIAEAQKVYDSTDSLTCDFYDYQVYLLYLHLHGSADDIGAKYAGYDFTGFDNEMKAGTKSSEIFMHRLYNPNTGEHLYTANQAEVDFLTPYGWQYEGVAWIAPATGDPVYRLYNPNNGDHHYTLSLEEKDWLVDLGWTDEGIAWYSGGDEAVYRLFNPNALQSTHHYTGFADERDWLVGLGWQSEQIAWYAVSIPKG